MPREASPEAGERCPLCGDPSSPEHRPFCSRRCADRDLLSWLGDGYRIPGPPADPEAQPNREDGLDSQP